MKFNRVTIETDRHQLAALVAAAEAWLPQKAVNRTHVAVVAAMPAVAAGYKRAASKCGQLASRQARGRKLPRGGKVNFPLTVPEAAAVMAYLGEQLLDSEQAPLLRLLRGSIHQQLSIYDGLAYEQPD